VKADLNQCDVEANGEKAQKPLTRVSRRKSMKIQSSEPIDLATISQCDDARKREDHQSITEASEIVIPLQEITGNNSFHILFSPLHFSILFNSICDSSPHLENSFIVDIDKAQISSSLSSVGQNKPDSTHDTTTFVDWEVKSPEAPFQEQKKRRRGGRKSRGNLFCLRKKKQEK